MKARIALATTLLLCTSTVLAQGKMTVIEILDGRTVGVKQVEREIRDVFPSFTEADRNGDGCVDRQEARLVGILRFDKANTSGSGCLNEAEFVRAANSDV